MLKEKQMRRRNIKDLYITINGRTLTLERWCFDYNASVSEIYDRYISGIRGEDLFDLEENELATRQDLKRLWGGRWIRKNKKPVRWNDKKKWVYVGGSPQVS